MANMQNFDFISKKITVDTFKKVLQKKYSDPQLSLKSWNLQDDQSSKGDSYLSEVYRFTLIGVKQNKDFVSLPIIIKCLPKNTGRVLTFRSPDYFRNEIFFYEEIWPKLNKFQLQQQVLEPFTEIPLYLYGLHDGENDFIILEDVSPQNFKSLPRNKGMTYETVLYIIRAFAKFHSLSYAYKINYPNEFKKLVDKSIEPYWSKELRNWYDSFFNQLALVWLDAVHQEVPNTVYEKRLQSLFENDFFGVVIDLIEKTRSISSTVFTHGDTWVPNFLVKLNPDTNHIENLVIIDFQLVRPSSPAFDLAFFLFTCTEKSLRDKHFNEILHEYHKVFTQYLYQLGVKTQFTFDMFWKDFKQNCLTGIAMTFEALVMSMLDEDEVSDLNSIKEGEKVDISTVWIVKPFDSKEKRQRCTELILELIDRGFI